MARFYLLADGQRTAFHSLPELIAATPGAPKQGVHAIMTERTLENNLRVWHWDYAHHAPSGELRGIDRAYLFSTPHDVVQSPLPAQFKPPLVAAVNTVRLAYERLMAEAKAEFDVWDHRNDASKAERAERTRLFRSRMGESTLGDLKT
jgi:hypothetical protein